MSKVKQHYERDGLVKSISDALERAGLGNKTLSIQELAPLDHFHSRGVEATADLCNGLIVKPESKVLDIGSGLGGPARYFASKFGCSVTGIDLTQSYVDAATYLTERTGLQDKVTFDCGDALALPYADNTFDVVITQHVAMNIENRERFYSEAFRVLKPGGQFALYDVTAGEGTGEPEGNDEDASSVGEPYFPVPWADGPSTSFLKTPQNLREILELQGFEISTWLDRSDTAIAWFNELVTKQKNAQTNSAPALGLNIILGSDFGARASNLNRSLKEKKVSISEAILRKPA